jgi:Cu(I)/Ag(I) efflux system protein CusF
MLKSTRLVFVTVFAFGAAGGVVAQDRMPNMPNMPRHEQAAEGESHGVGVVQSVDMAGGRVTIAHEPIKELNWPAMTMGFKVSDPALLQNITAGKKVEFMLKGKDMSAVITQLKVVE